jgi:hypothetical protein
LEDEQTFSVGALRVDPVAFVVTVIDSGKETLDPQATLNDVLQQGEPKLFAGFHKVVGRELRRVEEVSYLFDQQATPEGRTCDRYFLLQGTKVINVMVLYSKETSSSWREAASQVPFSIRVR